MVGRAGIRTRDLPDLRPGALSDNHFASALSRSAPGRVGARWGASPSSLGGEPMLSGPGDELLRSWCCSPKLLYRLSYRPRIGRAGLEPATCRLLGDNWVAPARSRVPTSR